MIEMVTKPVSTVSPSVASYVNVAVPTVDGASKVSRLLGSEYGTEVIGVPFPSRRLPLDGSDSTRNDRTPAFGSSIDSEVVAGVVKLRSGAILGGSVREATLMVNVPPSQTGLPETVTHPWNWNESGPT